MKAICLVVAALLALAHATGPPCFAQQTQYNFNFQEFHDVSRKLEDVVVSRAQVYTDYGKNQSAVYGDIIQGGTTFIGAIFMTPTTEYVWIHGNCSKTMISTTFQRCIGLDPFRNTTFGNLPAAVYRLTAPSGQQTQNSAWYWFTNPQQPFAWQSYYTDSDGTEVGTQSYVIDGYLNTITDPTKLKIPANCLSAEPSEVVNPRHAKLASMLRQLVAPTHVQSPIRNIVKK